MRDEESLLAPRNLPRLPPELRLTGSARRIGDGIVHDAWIGLHRGRLREYAPAGVAVRGDDGALAPREEFRRAWREGCARFLHQAERLREAALPGVAAIWEVGDMSRGVWLIAAPPGEALAVPLAAGLAIAPGEVMRIAEELGDTLAEVHAIGLAHLDIGPDTVSIDDGRIVLSDFAVDNRAFLALLHSDAGLVRPGYSAIEMYDGARTEPLGAATDVHAASALILRLVTGEDPTPWQQRWRDGVQEEVPGAADYPAAFIAALRRGFAIEAEQRFPDAAAWRDAMRGSPPPHGYGHGEGEAYMLPGAAAADPHPYPPAEAAAAAAPGYDGSAWGAKAAVLAALAAVLAIALFLMLTPGQETQQAASLYLVTGPANIRSAPSPGAEVVGRLNAGARVTGLMEDVEGGQRWLRVTEGPNAGAFIWARNLAVPDAAPSLPTSSAPVTPRPPAPEPLDLSARFAVDRDEICRFSPQLDPALQRMVTWSEATGMPTMASEVRIAGQTLRPSTALIRADDVVPGGRIYRSTLALPGEARWNKLRLRGLYAEAGYFPETDGYSSTGLEFAEPPGAVRAELARMGYLVPEGRGGLELETNGCGGTLMVNQVPGGSRIECSFGC